MANKINIDELLKQELADFHPDAPSGAWDAINQSLPNTAVQAGAAAGKAGAMATVKIVAAIVTVAASVTAGVMLFSNQNKLATKPVANKTEPLTNPSNENKSEEATTEVSANKVISSPIKSDEGIKFPSEQFKSVKNQQPAITTNSDVKSAVSNQQPIQTSEKPIKEVVIAKQETKSGELTEKYQTETKPTETPEPYLADNKEYSEPNIPNVFTPNNDGYNDEYVITIENEIMYDLKIMDAKGNVVFESKDKNTHWSGVNQHSGNNCEPGVYAFAFRYQTKGMNEAKVKQGRILLKL